MGVIFDIETNGLLDEVDRIHCLSYYDINRHKLNTLTDYDDMASFIQEADCLIGHDINRYDLPVIKKILGVEPKGQIIDTLALSWYLYPDRVRHGLGPWGSELGFGKPVVEDWEDQPLEVYIHRCESDVQINFRLWDRIQTYLDRLYGESEWNRIVNYLTWKMQCAAEQYDVGWPVNYELVNEYIDFFSSKVDEKLTILGDAMPLVEKWATKNPPAKPYKKDGTRSVSGSQWLHFLRDLGYPEDHNEPVEYLISTERGNPTSTPQVKDWLFSLGWEPATLKWAKNAAGGEYTIPQVRVDNDGIKELCPSVLALADKEPAINALSDLTVYTHRLNILKKYVSMRVGDGVRAEIAGLTNTLRFKHADPCVNLPGVSKAYGEVIRGALTAPKGMVTCGSDVSSLEENTKKHFIWPYDPDYVRDMSTPGFDAHLDLARQAGRVTEEQIEAYKNGDMTIKPIRSLFKPVNYAAIYGATAKRIARETGMTIAQAKELLDVYWTRNAAVLELVEDLDVKRVGDKMWLFNPVSKLYYSLRFDKDRFSTLNQGTGVWVFDNWVKEVRKMGYRITAQFHDEIVLFVPEGQEEQCEADLHKAMEIVNEKLKLNVTIGVDVQFGQTYGDVH